MICGNRTFIPDIGQHRFCTLIIGLFTNPNHDMPNQENKVKSHRSGEWTWAIEYPMIGPDMPSGAYYLEDDLYFREEHIVEELKKSAEVSEGPNS